MFRCILIALSLSAAALALPGCHHSAPMAIEKLDETLPFSGYVVDQANLLSNTEGQALTDRLGRFQRETGHQMAVVTVTSLHGEDIKTFSTALAKRWGVGRKGVNDGILILVAPNERKTRIAIGLGLESELPDDVCRSIMNAAIVPPLANGAYGEGIDAGVTAIIERLAAAEKKAAA
ncbi:hypothetical protein DMC47_44775 [Nostoc sp. 3335mG]|nr:hypothetical protein DMC47_44775 [Nostoc sp. 3335mG]